MLCGEGDAISLTPNPRVAGFNPFIGNVGLSYIRGRLNLRASVNYRHTYLDGYNVNESRASPFPSCVIPLQLASSGISPGESLLSLHFMIRRCAIEGVEQFQVLLAIRPR